MNKMSTASEIGRAILDTLLHHENYIAHSNEAWKTLTVRTTRMDFTDIELCMSEVKFRASIITPAINNLINNVPCGLDPCPDIRLRLPEKGFAAWENCDGVTVRVEKLSPQNDPSFPCRVDVLADWNIFRHELSGLEKLKQRVEALELCMDNISNRANI